MWLMLQQPDPDDYVLATGETHSVRELVEVAFDMVGRHIVWRGVGLDEKGIDEKTGEELVHIDQRYFRPVEVDLLMGDASKARDKLGWVPRTSFRDMISEMVNEDLRLLSCEQQRRNSDD
jgi:GDPmannose 4,6-dehydratase